MFLLYTKVFPLHTTYIYNTGVEKIIMYCFSWSFQIFTKWILKKKNLGYWNFLPFSKLWRLKNFGTFKLVTKIPNVISFLCVFFSKRRTWFVQKSLSPENSRSLFVEEGKHFHMLRILVIFRLFWQYDIMKRSEKLFLTILVLFLIYFNKIYLVFDLICNNM